MHLASNWCVRGAYRVVMVTRVTPSQDRVAEAMVLLQRYSLEMNEVASAAFGQAATAGIDAEILGVIGAGGDTSPSALVARLAMPRSTLARGLVRLRRHGLVERSVDAEDARRAVLRPTASGEALLEQFRSALADFLQESAPVVKEVKLLLDRDPEGDRGAESPRSLDEVLDRMTAGGAAYGHDVRAAAAEHGVTETPDRFCVVFLAVRESRPSLIAEHLRLTPAGTTSLLDRLEALGLVERRTGAWPADRRAVLVRLTPAGRRAADDIVAVFRRHADELLDTLGATLRFAKAA